MTDENLLVVELLRRHVVCLLCICENTSLQVAQEHLDRECLVGRNGLEVGWVLELALGHVGLWDNVTHWDRIARARCDLLTVCDCLPGAVVDKVVRACQRGDLTSLWSGLTILFKTGFDEIREKS